jgi:hypothetical protein
MWYSMPGRPEKSMTTRDHLVADCLGNGHAQGDADVFHRVVVVDMGIARGLHVQVDQAVARDLVQHMVEEGNARVQFLNAGAIKIEGDTDLRLVGIARNFSGAVHGKL